MKKEWFESWFDSKYYPILYQHRSNAEAEMFIQKLLGALKLPAGSKVLDLACGRGRHAVYLNQQGLDVTGIDLSAQSIEEAKSSENEKLRFEIHDMRKPFHLGQFDLILNLFTSFGYFNELNENHLVLRNVSDALNVGSIFVLDFLNRTRTINELVKSETKELDGVHFDIRRSYDEGFIRKEITVKDKGSSYYFEEKVQAIKKSDFEQMFRESNLQIDQVWGDYKGEAFDEETSSRLILIAQKI